MQLKHIEHFLDIATGRRDMDKCKDLVNHVMIQWLCYYGYFNKWLEYRVEHTYIMDADDEYQTKTRVPMREAGVPEDSVLEWGRIVSRLYGHNGEFNEEMKDERDKRVEHIARGETPNSVPFVPWRERQREDSVAANW